jgi:CRISPR-associated exonuclease Cas4
MFSIVVIMLSAFALLLYLSRVPEYFGVISFYLNLFSIVWLFLAFAFFVTVIYKDRAIKRMKERYKGVTAEDEAFSTLKTRDTDGEIPWLTETTGEKWELAKWFFVVALAMGICGVITFLFPENMEIYLLIFGAIFWLALSLVFFYFLNAKDKNKFPKFLTVNGEYKTISSAIVATGLAIFAVLVTYYKLSDLGKILAWSSLLWASAALFFFYSSVKMVAFLSRQYSDFYMKIFHKDPADLSASELLRLLVRRREQYRKGCIWLVVVSLFLAMSGFVMNYVKGLPDPVREVLGRLLLIIALIWLMGAFIILYYLLKNARRAKKYRDDKGIEEGRIDYVDLMDKKESTLYGKTLNISGKPDIILEKDGYYIPEEIKTGKIPRGPYFSHILQLAAYLKLVEDNYGIRPLYGYIQYGDKEDNRYKIHYDKKLENLLAEKVGDMEELMKTGDVHRNHRRFGKCSNCSRRSVCPENLAKEGHDKAGKNRDEGGGTPEKQSTLKEGDIEEVTITDIGKKGDGLTRVDGRVIFVPGVVKGDRIKIRITKIQRNIAFGAKIGDMEEFDSDKDKTGP